jgi:hypothetical protein
MTDTAPGATLPPPAPPITAALAPGFCNRLHGKSIKDCACRLPHKGGWMLCPPEARGLLEPVEPARRAPISAPSVFSVGPSVVKPSGPISYSGEMCREPGCGGFTIRTGSCMTCQSCGANEGCG